MLRCASIYRKEIFMKLFDPNGSVARFLNRLGDLMLLNLLCIICCLPFFTAGASISAMHYVTLRMHRGQDEGVWKDFFHSFRQNLKQGILIHLLFTVGALVLGLDLYILWVLWEFDFVYKILFVILAILTLWFLGIWMFIYPLLAQFNNTLRGFLKSARYMSLRHISYTCAILLVSLAPWLVGLYVPYALEWIIFFYLMIGFAAVTRFLARYFVTIFDQYIDTEAA